MVLQRLAGESDECVVEGHLVDPELVGDHLIACQVGSYRVQHVADSGHHHLLTELADPGHVRQGRQLRLVDRRRGAESDPLLVVGPGDQTGRCVQSDQLARVDQGDPVGEALRLLHEMGDEDDGHAAVALLLDQGPGVTPSLRVETRCELVEDGDLGIADEGEGDGQPLFLPSGELGVLCVPFLGEIELVEEIGPVGRVPIEAAVEVECFPHLDPVGETALLELDAETFLHLGGVVL